MRVIRVVPNKWRASAGQVSMVFRHGGLAPFLYFAIVFLLWSCSYIDPCRQVEVLRKPSQDGLVAFVVVQRDCGATTSVATSVFVVRTGGGTDKARPIFKADHVEGLEVSWESPRHLGIRYEKARIFNYTNFWLSRDVEHFEYVVAIREQQR